MSLPLAVLTRELSDLRIQVGQAEESWRLHSHNMLSKAAPCRQPLRGGHTFSLPPVLLRWAQGGHLAPSGFRGFSSFLGGAGKVQLVTQEAQFSLRGDFRVLSSYLGETHLPKY